MGRTRSPGCAPLLVLLLLLLLTGLQIVASAEDSCKTKDGSEGTCRHLSQCETAREAIKRGEFPVICSYDGLTPIVCCSLHATTTTTTATTTTTTTSTTLKPALTTAEAVAMATELCNKHKETVFEWADSPSFIVPPQKYKRDTCGSIGVPLIVGGIKASPNEFPHMALLGYDSREEPKWLCGGSLISKQYVLSAAQCASSRDYGPPVVVRLGELNLNDHKPDSQHEDYTVVEFISHPDYAPRIQYNDLALVKLEREVKFTRSIRPACLNTLTDIPHEEAIATGWGRTASVAGTSADLLKVMLPIQPSGICRKFYSASGSRLQSSSFDGESMVCAGDLAGGKDTCQGDSGGPLQTRLAKPYCMYNIIGITSLGKSCGLPNSPAVYTRVSYFLPWIMSVVR